jgi:hypothetical protein
MFRRSIDGSRSAALACQAAQGLESRARVRPKEASSINIIDTIWSTLVLNAGGGYHVLLGGMERISVGMERFRSLS